MAPRRNGRGSGGGPNDPEDLDLRPLVNYYQRLDRRAQLIVLAVLFVGAMVVLAIYYQHEKKLWQEQNQQTHLPTATAPSTLPQPSASQPSLLTDPNLRLGNPSQATTDPANRSDYLMLKPYFDLSYNGSTGTPNWVSWRVAASDLGTAPRKQVFDPDFSLPADFYRVVHKDYTGSGFDRGHMCPHSDRAASVEMSYATFVMSNIIPQAPNVNRKAWERLESYGRDLVLQQHQRLYIVAGPAGRGGKGSSGPAETIAGGHVTVPAQCWKVMVGVPEDGGEDDLAKIDASTRVITVLMPNDNDAVGEQWSGFRTSPAEVERITGLQFFRNLPPAVAESLRRKVDDQPIPAAGPRRYSN